MRKFKDGEPVTLDWETIYKENVTDTWKRILDGVEIPYDMVFPAIYRSVYDNSIKIYAGSYYSDYWFRRCEVKDVNLEQFL